MTTDPSELRAQIENTRASLSDNVDALADQANPAHIAQRQVEKVKAKGSRLLDRVLGAAEDVRDSAVEGVQHAVAGVRSGVGDATDNVGQAVTGLPETARRQAQGNPVAAGLVAFGLGLLIAAAFPPSEKEEALARSVKEQAEPLTEQVTAAAKEVAQNLSEPAAQAVESLKESATEAVQAVQAEGSEAVSEVQSLAKDSASEVGDQAKRSADTVKEDAGTRFSQDQN